MMVPQFSALHAGKNEKQYDQLSIDADHSDIIKFDFSQPEYLIIASRIKQLIGQAPAVIAVRLANHEKSTQFLAFP